MKKAYIKMLELLDQLGQVFDDGDEMEWCCKESLQGTQ
jgi:hypothetical protein